MPLRSKEKRKGRMRLREEEKKRRKKRRRAYWEGKNKFVRSFAFCLCSLQGLLLEIWSLRRVHITGKGRILSSFFDL
jgi:hypothetical protein